jgi:hypothetical protein
MADITENITENIDEQINENAVLSNNVSSRKKINKTPIYYLNAIKKSQAKNKDKIKDYQEKYRLEQNQKKIDTLPNEKLTKSQLLIKIKKLEDELSKFKN